MASINKLSLSAKIFIAMILGAITGLILNFAGNPDWSQVKGHYL
jgi:Na+/H+-dicarboxylate symporter